MQAAGHRQSLHIKNDLAGLGLLLIDIKADAAAHHHERQLLAAGIPDIHRTDQPSLAQHRAAVGHLHDLGQLVGDEQDALAFPGKAAHHFHQLVDLLRGQYRRRLIKDQYLIIPVQHLEDLHTLLHAHRDILDLRVRVNFQAIALAELHHPFAGFILLQHAPAGLLGA